MTGPVRDFSKEYFASRLSPELIADIDRRVAEAPEPSQRVLEAVARVWVPVIDRILAEADVKARATA